WVALLRAVFADGTLQGPRSRSGAVDPEESSDRSRIWRSVPLKSQSRLQAVDRSRIAACRTGPERADRAVQALFQTTLDSLRRTKRACQRAALRVPGSRARSESRVVPDPHRGNRPQISHRAKTCRKCRSAECGQLDSPPRP